jgi:hypothetical protein
MTLPTYEECGCCGEWHLPEFRGDCRDDANRFTSDQLDAKHGENNWWGVTLEDMADQRAQSQGNYNDHA